LARLALLNRSETRYNSSRELPITRGGVQVMRGDVEICHQRGAWHVGIEGESVRQDGYRTLEEAIEIAWGMAAKLKVALHVGKDPAPA
jgi:hypothetical protein